MEATLRLQCHDTDPENYPLKETMELAQKALALTRPNFDYENFPSSVLTIFEVDLLHIIVAIWAGMDRNMDALRLGERLYASLKRHESDVVSYERAKINVVRNLGAILAKMKMYQDALQYIDEAEALSLKNNEHSLLVMIELTRAEIYCLIDRKEECADILKTLAAYTALTKQKTYLLSIQHFARDKLGLDL